MKDKIRYVPALIEKSADGEIQMAVFSDASVDRYQEIIDPNGWQLDNFKRNPVLLWAHDAHFTVSVPAIGTIENLHVDENGRLIGKPVFDTEDEFAMKIYKKMKKGIIRAFSVGFLPHEWDGNVYTRSELLEISVVNVPANPNALTQIKSMAKGIKDTDLLNDLKAKSVLMKEYLQKNGLMEQKAEDDNPLSERLQNIANQMQNAVSQLDATIRQLESTVQPEDKTVEPQEIKSADYADALSKLNQLGALTALAVGLAMKGGDKK